MFFIYACDVIAHKLTTILLCADVLYIYVCISVYRITQRILSRAEILDAVGDRISAHPTRMWRIVEQCFCCSAFQFNAFLMVDKV